MSLPFLGETRIFAFGFAPTGWMACEGQLVSIAELPALFNLIGAKYGGDGKTNFALPKTAGPDSEGTALSLCICLFGVTPAE